MWEGLGQDVRLLKEGLGMKLVTLRHAHKHVQFYQRLAVLNSRPMMTLTMLLRRRRGASLSQQHMWSMRQTTDTMPTLTVLVMLTTSRT